MTEDQTPATDALLSAEGPAPDTYFGRMNDPTAAAIVKGLCGDQMEIYLTIIDGVIQDAKYYTEGCIHTRVCGSSVARRASGKRVEQALGINPKELIDAGECLPEEGRHCAILAVSTLYRAIADYFLKP